MSDAPWHTEEHTTYETLTPPSWMPLCMNTGSMANQAPLPQPKSTKVNSKTLKVAGEPGTPERTNMKNDKYYIDCSYKIIKWATDYLTEDGEFTIEINADELAEDLYYKED